jgi:hypothetical protein
MPLSGRILSPGQAIETNRSVQAGDAWVTAINGLREQYVFEEWIKPWI